MAFIYKITNDVNKKVYIGKTLFSIEKRWKEHLNSRLREQCKNRPLYRAMNKYGVEHFSIEAVEQCIDESASEREKYWISYYNSYHNGYNATYGGDGIVRINRALVILLWLANKSITFINHFTGYNKGSISKILKSCGVTSHNIISRSCTASKLKNSNSLIILMNDLDGKFLRAFQSISEAANLFENRDSMLNHILDVCNRKGNRCTAGGYRWSYFLP